jgi:lipid-A-disaccharide synthase
MHGFPQGAPRVAIFPGSRSHEVKANIRLLAKAFTEIQGRHGRVAGLISAASPEIADLIRRRVPVFPTGLHMVTGQNDAVIAWSELCLAVSGTITLDIARQRRPMVGVYKTSLFASLAAGVLLRAPLRLLPNIIAEREICPEFVPHAGGAGPIAKKAHFYLNDSKNAAIQAEELGRVCQRYQNKKPDVEAARLILRLIKDGTVE